MGGWFLVKIGWVQPPPPCLEKALMRVQERVHPHRLAAVPHLRHHSVPTVNQQQFTPTGCPFWGCHSWVMEDY